MRLKQVQVRDYRSVNDSGRFEVEHGKTILVGINEAGKTCLLIAIEQLNAPPSRPKFKSLKDYPRARYTEVQRGDRHESDVEVVEAAFVLDDADRAAVAAVAPDFAGVEIYHYSRYLDNHAAHSLDGGPHAGKYADIEEDLHRTRKALQSSDEAEVVLTKLDAAMQAFVPAGPLAGAKAEALEACLSEALAEIDEDNARELDRIRKLRAALIVSKQRNAALSALSSRLPKFVYYSTYFQVHPRIDLRSLSARESSGDLDDAYDFGNLCLLRLVGLTAKELVTLAEGEPTEAEHGGNAEAYQAALVAYQEKLDDRQNRLNAASVTLTQQIREVWGDERVQLRFVVDGRYLKVTVVDDVGVEVELDQRSEGFRWLVSFFVVFRAQAEGELKNAVLLLDEPGLSLHALKQQQFRYTVGQLAGDNQVIYTTHSPFMVGSDELDLVRIVEMKDRAGGTKVHTRIAVDDPDSLYPLQAALGYELAQAMFTQVRNLVCEGFTDMLYIEALNAAAADSGSGFKHAVALVPASSASKVIYYVTVLVSQKLKVAALLDSDQAGDKAAQQDELVAMLQTKRLLRTKDFVRGTVRAPEIEDLLRDTLVAVAKDRCGWDVKQIAADQPDRRLVDILAKEAAGFSKNKLARAFLSWLGANGFEALTEDEQKGARDFFTAANKALN
ncbi:AAA family ATPase [Cellulomonas hominis]